MVPALGDSPPSGSPSQAHSSSSTRSIADGNGVDFEYWFEQLIDHNNPNSGTFRQRYFFSDQYWKGDGSPIILQTPGETPADGSLQMIQKGFLQSKMMVQLGAAGVILEHRYWGKSSPVPDLTTQNLQWLTVEQAVEDLKAAVDYMDDVMLSGEPHEVISLKQKFGLEALANDDFANALTYPLITWQDLQPPDFGNNGEALFFKFCDAVETKSDGTINQSDEGIGLPQALENWAAYFKSIGPDTMCPGTGGACFSTYNYSSDFYTNISISNNLRGWEWLLCTQLGAFPIGGRGTIVSRLLDAAFQDRRCAHLFLSPTGDAQASPYNTTQSADAFNLKYDGWNLLAKNLFVVNGEFDPWRSASLSSRAAPAFDNVPYQDVIVIPDGHHCWDWSTSNAAVNLDVERVQDLGISTIRFWLDGWYDAHPAVRNSNGFSPEGLEPHSGPTMSSLQDTVNSMQDEINRLRQRHRAAIASYVFNAVLSLALLSVLALIIKEWTP
ncbi:Thymus-specific serine protease, partial [Tulasnella sp. 408]